MRILVTSDLHLEHTGSEAIRRFVAGMTREEPDAVVLAGDLGNPARLFEQCLSCFRPLDCPIAVLPGNHDIWNSPGETSALLYNEVLPEITRSFGYHWLESDPLLLDEQVAICGSIAWYDYSARDHQLLPDIQKVVEQKPRYAMDALRVDWEWDDITFAGICRSRLQKQLMDLEQDARVKNVLVATHVPVFENQMDRRPEDLNWNRGNAYFGHLTMGECLRGATKLRTVVSGHTHVGMNGVVERSGNPIATAVIPSDYGKPRWITVDL